MGSPPTLDPTWSRRPDLDRPDQDPEVSDGQEELLAHLQTPAAFGGTSSATGPRTRSPAASAATWTPATATTTPACPTSSPTPIPTSSATPSRDGEQAFDRLNPEFGIPIDQHNPYGRQAVRDREAALALGVRVAVHDSRQNDPSPVIWQPGQDYRMADAIQAARHQPTRTRWGPERTGPER